MSDNNDNGNNLDDDLDDGNFDDSSEFDDFEGGNGTLGDLWRNNPLVKVGVILAAFVTILGGIILFGGQPQRTPPSVMRGTADLKQAPGTDPVSEAYGEAVREVNVQDAERAMREGTSALPVPISPPRERVVLEEPTAAAEDPLERWRRIQEERQRRDVKMVPDAPVADPHAGAINALAEAMAAQMESILGSLQPIPPHYLAITNEEEYLQRIKARAEEEARRQAEARQAAAERQNPTVIDILIPAGNIEYGQMITEANTDAPGPVLAHILSGPLRGSRLLGSFNSMENYLVLSFNTIVIDGVSQSINAVALDPRTANTGMATEVNNRYFQRIVLPAAAAFVEGMGSAIAESGTTTVTVSGDTVIEETSPLNTRQEIYKGVGEAASKIGQLMDREAGRIRPLIRVASGTPMGILFLDPVTQQTR